jgi:hypothetical protein
MLVRVLPEQVAENWQSLKPVILASLPPIVDDSGALSNEHIAAGIMKGLLNETIQGWIIAKVDSGTQKQENVGFMSTTINRDLTTGIRNLLIYSFYFTDPKYTDWADDFKTLKAFAKHQQCSNIDAYVEDKRFLTLWKRYSGNKRFWYYIKLDVNDVEVEVSEVKTETNEETNKE